MRESNSRLKLAKLPCYQLYQSPSLCIYAFCANIPFISICAQHIRALADLSAPYAYYACNGDVLGTAARDFSDYCRRDFRLDGEQPPLCTRHTLYISAHGGAMRPLHILRHRPMMFECLCFAAY